MKYLLLIFLVASGGKSAIAQVNAWQQITVGDSTTVDFPGEPKKIIHKGETAYGLYKEGMLYAVAIQKNAAEFGLTIEEKRRLYDEVMRGATETAHATQIFNKTRFELNSFEGLETTFVAASDKFKNPVVMRTILINTTLYSQTFSAPTSAAHTTARQHFFASFAPRLRPVAATPAETRTAAYQLGQLIGRVMVYGGIIVGIVWLIGQGGTTKRKKSIT